MERENEFLYLQLAQNIREQILTGFLKPGKFLLSENQLCKQYKISRSSVRKALDLLVQEGLIAKRVGQGTFVAPELPVREDRSRTLTIVATSPSYFIDYCMPQVIAAFRREYPHVAVKVLSIPGAAFRESLEASLEMGFQPDLLFVSDYQWKEFVQYPSSEFHDLKSLSDDLPHPIYPNLAQSFAFGGQTSALPVSFSSVYLVYNPQLFAGSGVEPPQPGWQAGDFLATAEALTRDKDGDGIADVCGFSLPISLSRWPAVALSFGVRFERDHDSQAMTRTLAFFHDMLFRRKVAALTVRS
ncbi:MAG: GntR family transcriptional regulator, partial [Paenibacillaceae bacterium]|nr:GntR family transcriptional regulator [Paenibacillaceae bacterium]